ncbi:MAG: hypothetical protein WBA46_16160 [Thermomicrobiales bacterium]
MRVRLLSLAGVLALFATLACGTSAGTLAVATPDASGDVSPVYNAADLPGLHQAVARSYTADLSALFATREAAATTATPAAPDYAAMGVVTLNAVVLQFDSEQHAAAAFTVVVEKLTSPASTGGIDLGEVEVEGFTGPVRAFTASVDQGPGLSLHQAVLLTQAGPYVYQTIAVGLSSSEDSLATATAVANAMIATPAGEGAATFKGDGTSSGGIWDKFPIAGDSVLAGMTPEFDDPIVPAS